MKKNIIMTILVCATAASMIFGILYHITGTIHPTARQPKTVQIEEKKDSAIRLVEESSDTASKSEAAPAEKETDKAASAPDEKKTAKADSESDKSAVLVLDIDLDLGDLTVVTGDEVNVEYSGSEKYRPVVSLEDGTLEIYQNPQKNWFNLKSIKAKITVTLPEGTRLEELEISESLGDVKLQDLNAASGTVDNDLGDIWVNGCDIGELSISSSMGDVEMDGTVFHQLDVKQDMGDVKINYPEDLTDAELDLQTDLGSVKVNGNKQGTSHYTEGKGDVSVKVENDLGDIKLNWSR